jgi:hypothetical protein
MKQRLTSLAALAALSTALALSTGIAQAQQSAESLLAGKQTVEMTYRELMQILQRALGMMQDGVLLQNQQLVRQGAEIVLHHPAPRTAPWTIVSQDDQEGFKQALLTYDKVLDINTLAVRSASDKADWMDGAARLAELQTACVSCHVQWREKVRLQALPRLEPPPASGNGRTKP